MSGYRAFSRLSGCHGGCCCCGRAKNPTIPATSASHEISGSGWYHCQSWGWMPLNLIPSPARRWKRSSRKTNKQRERHCTLMWVSGMVSSPIIVFGLSRLSWPPFTAIGRTRSHHSPPGVDLGTDNEAYFPSHLRIGDIR